MRGGLVVLIAAALAACGGDDIGAGGADARVTADAGVTPAGLIASWDFEEGDGVTITDTSGIEPTLELEIFDFNKVTWGVGFLRIDDTTIARTVGPAKKIIDKAIASDEISVEMWIRPAQVDQGSATIAAIGRDGGNHNVWAGAEGPRYSSRLRVNGSDLNGDPHTTPDDTVEVALTHVVFAYSAAARRIYVNGRMAGEEVIDGNFDAWDVEHELSFGGEANQDGGRFWSGELHRLVIYDRFLSEQQASGSFDRGASPL